MIASAWREFAADSEDEVEGVSGLDTVDSKPLKRYKSIFARQQYIYITLAIIIRPSLLVAV